MAKWPDTSVYTPIKNINKGNEYQEADGLTAADMNAIVENIDYLYNNSGTGAAYTPTDLDLNTGVVTVTYDATNGIDLNTQGKIKSTKGTDDVIVDYRLPIVAGEGISIDKAADKEQIIIKGVGNSNFIDIDGETSYYARFTLTPELHQKILKNPNCIIIFHVAEREQSASKTSAITLVPSSYDADNYVYMSDIVVSAGLIHGNNSATKHFTLNIPKTLVTENTTTDLSVHKVPLPPIGPLPYSRNLLVYHNDSSFTTHFADISDFVQTDDLASYAKTNDVVAKSQVGAVNGVASLGTDGKVPAGQLPTIDNYSKFVEVNLQNSDVVLTYSDATGITITSTGSMKHANNVVDTPANTMIIPIVAGNNMYAIKSGNLVVFAARDQVGVGTSLPSGSSPEKIFIKTDENYEGGGGGGGTTGGKTYRHLLRCSDVGGTKEYKIAVYSSKSDTMTTDYVLANPSCLVGAISVVLDNTQGTVTFDRLITGTNQGPPGYFGIEAGGVVPAAAFLKIDSDSFAAL